MATPALPSRKRAGASQNNSTTSGRPATYAQTDPLDPGNQVNLATQLGEDKWTNAQSSILVRELFQEKFHPVLVFGVTESGKTTLVCSVINYFKTNTHGLNADIRLIDLSLLEEGQPFGAALNMQSRAHDIFHVQASELLYKIPARTDQNQEPFFVALEIKFKQADVPTLRLAFMDASGEHLFDRSGARLTPRGSLKTVVETLVSDYQKPLTMLYVLPPGRTITQYTSNKKPPSAAEQAFNDQALASLIGTQYKLLRKPALQTLDRHLLVFTHWDEHKHWEGADFLKLDKHKTFDSYQNNYPATVGVFCSLGLNQRAWMCYSSALVGRGGNLQSSTWSRQVLGLFTNRLMDWLSTSYVSAFANELLNEVRSSPLANRFENIEAVMKGYDRYFRYSKWKERQQGKVSKSESEEQQLHKRKAQQEKEEQALERERQKQELEQLKAQEQALADELQQLKEAMVQASQQVGDLQEAASGGNAVGASAATKEPVGAGGGALRAIRDWLYPLYWILREFGELSLRP